MGTPLDEIFDRFYSLIKDTDLAKLSDEEIGRASCRERV